MLMIDLFSGTGSASQPFKDQGWKVYRYDIDPLGPDAIFTDLNHEMFILQIINAWKGLNVDLLWASPPCTEYSYANKKTNDPLFVPNTLLWHNTMRIIEAVRPKNFIIENVQGAQRTWGPAVQNWGSYYFWGVFPKFSVPDKIKAKLLRQKSYDNNKKLRAKECATIPYTIGKHLERAISLQERFK
jgi:site-specific DNA-cytosine methylase